MSTIECNHPPINVVWVDMGEEKLVTICGKCGKRLNMVKKL